MQAGDWTRITNAALSSKMVEDFRVTVTENKVTLIPPSLTIIQGDRKTIECVIQDGAATLGPGEAFVYRWTTTGNFGTPTG